MSVVEETTKTKEEIMKEQENKFLEKNQGINPKKQPLIQNKGQKFDSADYVLKKEKLKQMGKKELPKGVKEQYESSFKEEEKTKEETKE